MPALQRALGRDVAARPDDPRGSTAAAARELVPVLRPDRVEAAIFEPDAMDIDVHTLHQGYLRLFRRRGGRVETDARGDGRCRGRAARGLPRRRAANSLRRSWSTPPGPGPMRSRGSPGCRRSGCMPKRRTAMIVPAPPGFDIGRWPMAIDAEETGYFKPDAGKLAGLAGRRDAGAARATCSPKNSTSRSRSTG